MSGQRFVLRVPPTLKEKIERAAKAHDQLPTEWLRDVARQAVEKVLDGDQGAP